MLTLICAAAGAWAQARNDGVIYSTRFEQGAGRAPAGWTAQGGARWDAIGRTGRSLKISTWEEGGLDSLWLSPRLPVAGKQVTLSVWAAQNIVFAQDPGYCGQVSALLYDEAGKETSRRELVQISKPEKRAFYEGQLLAPEGLHWTYHERLFDVPPTCRSFRIALAWSAFANWRHQNLVNGEVWIDDLRLCEADCRMLPRAAAASAAELPFRLSVHTPVDVNFFLPSDPLEFDVLVYGEGSAPKPDKATTLHYEVTDYQRLLVEEGSCPLAPWFTYEWEEEKKTRQGLFKVIYLGEKTRRAPGRWLALKVELRQGERVLARNETCFALLNPTLPATDAEVFASRVLGGTSRGRFREQDSLYGRGRRLRQHAWNMPGRPSWRELANIHGMPCRGWDSAWRARQPTRASPIDFSKEPEVYKTHGASSRVFSWEERVPAWRFLAYTQAQRAVPEWAWIAGARGERTIDPVAYAEYAAQFVRHTNATHYIVTSIEGPDVLDFTELVLRSARAIKAVDKRLTVGAGLDFQTGSPAQQAAQLDELGVLDVVDFLCYDIYASRLELRALKGELAKLGKPKEIWFTEYAYPGARDQVGRARGVVDYYLYALGGDVDKIRWFPCPCPPWSSTGDYSFGPDVRGPFVLPGRAGMTAGWRTLGEGPRVCPALTRRERAWHPWLQLVTIHHLNRLFQHARNGRELRVDNATSAYLFDADDGAVMGLWRRHGTGAKHCLLDCAGVAFEITDLYGRRSRIAPRQGRAVITVSEDPILLKFEGAPGQVKVAEAPIRLTTKPAELSVGGQHQIQVAATNPFPARWRGSFRLGVGPRWDAGPEQAVDLQTGESGTWTAPIRVPRGAVPGSYPLFGRFFCEGKQVGLTVVELPVRRADMSLSLASAPAAGGNRAAVAATVRNNRDRPARGEVTFVNAFTNDLQPAVVTKPYTVAPGGAARLVFELDVSPSLTRKHDVKVTLRDEDGTTIEAREDLFFIGVPKAARRITVDGDLSDWGLEDLVPLRFFCENSRGYSLEYRPDAPGNTWSGPEDADVRLYSVWEAGRLCFAARIRDDCQVNGGEYNTIWGYDCLHFCLYPWELRRGENMRAPAYKDHIGLDKSGKSTLDRCLAPFGRMPGKKRWPEGAEFVGRKVDGGYVFEWCYPAPAVAPLELRAGSKFRVAATYHDRDGEKYDGSGVCWFFGTTNVEGTVTTFGQLQLVEE